MTQQITKDLEPTYKQISSNLTKEIEKTKKLSDENKIFSAVVGVLALATPTTNYVKQCIVPYFSFYALQ